MTRPLDGLRPKSLLQSAVQKRASITGADVPLGVSAVIPAFRSKQ